MTNTPLTFRLAVQARNHSCDFLINDLPIDSFGRDMRRRESANISHLIIEGQNELTLEMSLFECIDYDRDEQGLVLPPNIRGELTASEQDGENVRAIAQVEWSGNPGIFPEPITNCRSEASFTIDRHCGRWAWETADVVDITAAVRSEIVAFVQELHAAMHRGDPKPYYEAAAIRTEERARAMPKADPQRDQEQAMTMIDAQYTVGKWALEPIEADNLILRPFGYGRVIQVLHEFEDHPIPGHPLRSTSDSALGAMSFGMMVSRIAGRWQIVR